MVVLGALAWYTRSPRELVARPPIGAIFPIAENLYVVPGGGCNTAVFVTSRGVILVDTKYRERFAALMKEVRKVTDKPILYVINTHVHGDHRGGNALVPAGATILVQEHTAANMVKMAEQARGIATTLNESFPGVEPFRDQLTLLSGDEAVDIYYFGPAHTDGDVFVVFRKAGVMHVGDVFPSKVPSTINIAWGGDAEGFLRTIHGAVSVPGINHVITGHSDVLPWADFLEHSDFMNMFIRHARNSFYAGKTMEQARADLDLPARFKDYNLEVAERIIGDVYRSLKK
jgi:glyoxylase-like metal-dependent hydrolase (beta-lactamase superfamily II)